MRIRAHDVEAHADLTNVLRANGCAVEAGADTIDVQPARDDEGGTNLVFFLRAWAGAHPTATVILEAP